MRSFSFGFLRGISPIRGDIDMDEILFFQHFVIYSSIRRSPAPVRLWWPDGNPSAAAPRSSGCVSTRAAVSTSCRPADADGRDRYPASGVWRGWRWRRRCSTIGTPAIDRSQWVDLIVWPIGNFESGCESFEVELFIEFVRCFFAAFFCIGEMVVDVVDAFGLCGCAV